MKIILTDGYYITEDNYNYILNRRVKAKQRHNTKKEYKDIVVGYYSNGLKGFKACLRRYLEDLPLGDEKLAETALNVFCEHLESVISSGIDEITKNLSERIELDKRSSHDKQ